MKKLALSLSLALALSSVSTAFAAIPQKVRIGTDPTYAPFESKNAQGELIGFDIDLAKELCKRINTQCTFIENPLDALIPSLKAKKIDAIMSSLSITEKRQQEIAFTDKLYAADSRLVVKKGSDVTPDLAKLKGKLVGVLQGTTQETYGNEHWAPKGIEIVSYQGQDNIYSDLTAGRIDALTQFFCQIDVKTNQFTLCILRFERGISRVGTDTDFLRNRCEYRGNAGKGQR